MACWKYNVVLAQLRGEVGRVEGECLLAGASELITHELSNQVRSRSGSHEPNRSNYCAWKLLDLLR